jgi:hypothetical protein
MTTMIEIPTKSGTPEIVEGKVAWLQVGQKKHRFFIHGENLTDYRTGRRITSLNDAKVRRMCATGGCTQIDDRRAAQDTMDLIVGRLGQEKVLAELNKHPTLNR